MNILAIDLGKFKSVACVYRGEQDIEFRTIETRPQVIHDLLVELAPDKLVIEVGTVSGWVHDVATALGIEVQVAKQGPSLLRKLLVEVAWIMRQHNPHADALFKKLSKGQKHDASRRRWRWRGVC